MPTPPIPGQPHPDVAIVKSVLMEIAPGEVVPYDTVAKCIGLRGDDPVFRRRCDTARKQLEKEGHVISCVRAEGVTMELGTQTKARVEGRETRSIQRKAKRNVRQLNTIDVSKIPAAQRPELYGLMTVNRAVQVVTSKPARLKLTAAATAVSAEITVTKALEVLMNKKE